MAFLSSFNILGSGMTAQQLRLDVIAENVTNINTTRTESGGAYRRKMVVLESQDSSSSFQSALARSRVGRVGNAGSTLASGVRVVELAEDPSDLKLVYDPTHPDANAEGYVSLPNVDLVKEITDAMAATQAYSANVTAFNTLKAVIAKGLEIGR